MLLPDVQIGVRHNNDERSLYSLGVVDIPYAVTSRVNGITIRRRTRWTRFLGPENRSTH